MITELGKQVPKDISSVAFTNRAEAYLHGLNWQKALLDLEMAVWLDGTNTRALRDRGIIYQKVDREKAIADFRRFLQLAPNDPEAPNAREALRKLGAKP